MTREQAKTEIMQIYGSLSEEKKQALDVLMAQADGEYITQSAGDEIRQKNYDLISRQAVLDLAKFDERKGLGTIIHAFDVEQLPSVKPLEKTGHWKRISMDKYSEHAKYWYRCDRCGKDNLGNTDWCPNCGCRMIEPHERSDKE